MINLINEKLSCKFLSINILDFFAISPFCFKVFLKYVRKKITGKLKINNIINNILGSLNAKIPIILKIKINSLKILKILKITEVDLCTSATFCINFEDYFEYETNNSHSDNKNKFYWNVQD